MTVPWYYGERSNNRQSIIDKFVLVSQPDDNGLNDLIDGAHNGNLDSTFQKIFLVNADTVNAKIF